MRLIKRTNQFKRDIERIKSRGWDLKKLKEVIDKLYEKENLNPRIYKPHKLKGDYKDCWECHIKNNWLLIWFFDDDGNLVLVRTGTHEDLFE